jgi:hypothetical protein
MAFFTWRVLLNSRNEGPQQSLFSLVSGTLQPSDTPTRRTAMKPSG